jgi:glycerophosphoryl diester phosphodiesterase
MQIIEQSIVAKNPTKKCEDGIVVTKDYIAVIDGSTSKTDRRFSLFRSNGRYCMQLVNRYIRKAKGNLTCRQFCNGVTSAIARHYSRRDMLRLAEHPEERLTASAIVYSRLNREIWMIGDCQCLVGNDEMEAGSFTFFDNPKPYEQELAEQRAVIINGSNMPKEQFLEHDTAREAIIPHMLETMQQQNKKYAVIDGFPIPQQCVRIITLDFQPWEVVLASDGYPFLEPTLAASEERLAWQRTHDPLNIGQFKATKAFAAGNNSFDDRAYIRFRV